MDMYLHTQDTRSTNPRRQKITKKIHGIQKTTDKLINTTY